jgi:hypothetical protein
MNKLSSTHLSPEQINLLQIVCVMAWSDGEFSEEEQNILLSYCCEFFGENEQKKSEIQEYLHREIQEKQPLDLLEELVPKLLMEEDKSLALKLGYIVICISQKTGAESRINLQEKIAYRRLIELLNLPDDTVQKIEWAANKDLERHENPLEILKSLISSFLEV